MQSLPWPSLVQAEKDLFLQPLPTCPGLQPPETIRHPGEMARMQGDETSLAVASCTLVRVKQLCTPEKESDSKLDFGSDRT